MIKSFYTFAFCLIFLASISIAKPIPSLKLLSKRSTFNYYDNKIQGVNLGGWLLLEPYITPSLFEGFGDDIPVDEYNYCKYLGKEEALKRLQEHWSTFFTESDFADIAEYGLNAVRIPIGYWAFEGVDGDPYVQGQVEYLDKAIEWAAKYNLKVWVDLHGAPGSQNAFDNSGLRDSLLWLTGDNVPITLKALYHLVERYGGNDKIDTIIGIELLNEPLGPQLDMARIKQFYTDGYNILRNDFSSHQNVVILDAFMASGYYNDFMNLDDYYNVVLDRHYYQVFSPGELSRTIDQHILTACALGFASQPEYHWVVIGEWSGALTDCSYWLNGVNTGSRYEGVFKSSQYFGSCDGISDISTWSDQKKVDTRKYIEAQLDAWEMNQGWFFWTYKTESSLEWDFKRLSANGLFPSPLSDRQYPGQCY
ncbi:glycoside hydrolase family 5 protein [Ascoidea rubescens DSM 1968]|uniref:glucan 1,3-beta-glucosidase n=1 Tax=Ascoidea rubescens DSM 1968 TaxID=1344418 RepID=A0A1D2VNQ9_9ASCO|nr:glycoside hydrolase family 5 protein [Ascoidea rubescens DSM 1968]ODV63240.1 glycoside hydrolase family 5 protein [Ascoidea rubescens DSM 1968]